MPVTLKHIAREVGVSITTVSLVLNNKPSAISEKTKQRILEVARRKGYVPNQIARSLVTQHSQTLGLIIPNIESRFFASLARRLELGCRARGYGLFITTADESAPNDADLVRLLMNRSVDGLFLIPSADYAPDDPLVAMLNRLPVPLVILDRMLEGVRCHKISFDNTQGGYLATRELLEQGHRRIACVVNTDSNTGRERLRGYEQALQEFGMTADPCLEFASTYYVLDAYKQADAVLASGASAIFASSDNISLGLLRAIYERKLEVPKDISLVGYDNSAADNFFMLELTTVEQNVDVLAEKSISLMLDQSSTPYTTHSLLPRLVQKQSVQAPSELHIE